MSPVDNSECPACMPHLISLGYLLLPAASPSLRFGTGPMGGPFYLPQGQFWVERALILPERPKLAHPACTQPPIRPGYLSLAVATPCLGFRTGPAWGSLSPRLRGNLESKRAIILLERRKQDAQRPSRPTLAQAASDMVQHLPALDSVQVLCVRAPFLPASGGFST